MLIRNVSDIGVRYLLEKHKKKMRRGKGDSGSYEKDTERDNLW